MQRAQPFLIDDLGERIGTITQRRFPVRLPEECGVGQSRPDDPFVTVAHPVRLLAVEVGDRDKDGQQLTTIVGDRKVSLVARQRRDNDFVWQFEIGLVEGTAHRHRPLGQCRHFIVKRVIADGRAAGGRCCRAHTVDDLFASGLEVGDDVTRTGQRRFVIASAADADVAR